MVIFHSYVSLPEGTIWLGESPSIIQLWLRIAIPMWYHPLWGHLGFLHEALVAVRASFLRQIPPVDMLDPWFTQTWGIAQHWTSRYQKCKIQAKEWGCPWDSFRSKLAIISCFNPMWAMIFRVPIHVRKRRTKEAKHLEHDEHDDIHMALKIWYLYIPKVDIWG